MKKINSLLTLCLLLCVTALWSQDFEIYVSDAGGFTNPPWKVMRFDENGDTPETLDDSNVAWPQDILILEDQNIFLVSSLNTGVISRHDLATGAYIDDFATGIGGPTRMKIGADDLIYVLQWTGNGTVLRYMQDGTFVDEFTSEPVTNAIGLDWDSSGNLYVSSFNGDSVRQFDSSGNDMGLFINSNLVGPTNILFRGNGDLLVVDWSGGDVKLFNSAGVFQEVFIPDLSQPEGIDVYPNGDILIGDGGNAAVNKYASDGTFIEVFIESGEGGLIQPNAVIIRDTSLSVEAVETSTVFVTPTVGTNFNINEQVRFEFERLQIFDISGKLVETLYLDGRSMLQASDYADGVYFIVAIKNGQRFTQRIIVAR